MTRNTQRAAETSGSLSQLECDGAEVSAMRSILTTRPLEPIHGGVEGHGERDSGFHRNVRRLILTHLS
jgi:hypothetical protein